MEENKQINDSNDISNSELNGKSKGIHVIVLLITCAFTLFCGMVYWTHNKNAEEENQKQEEKELFLSEIEEMQYVVPMGDDVVYIFEPDGTLCVTGKGSTWDFETLDAFRTYIMETMYEQYAKRNNTATKLLAVTDFAVVLDCVTTIEIDQGITELGRGSLSSFSYVSSVSVPETLSKVRAAAFMGTGQSVDNTEWEGLQLFSIEFEETSFEACNGVEIIKSEDQTPEQPVNNEKKTPTEYDLNTMELVEKVKMGNEVTYELYDNGILMVKGTGSTYSFENHGLLYEHVKDSLYCMTRNEVYKRWFDQITYIIVTEGVTELGDYALGGMWSVEEILIIPELKKIGENAFWSMGINTKNAVAWFASFADTACAQTAFDNCKNKPEGE